MKYKELKSFEFASIGEEVLTFWKENKLFEKSVEIREGNPTFTFYEGPPSANGTPGIHHVMARAVKDVFCRYKTMQGFQVKRKGGWDTHGLPVELQVEKELGITKEDIGKKISVAEYNQKCKEAVMKFTDQWNDLTEKMGYWVDLEKPYITYEPEYVESLWWVLKKLYDKGLLYKGYTIQPYSPAAGTGLSSHELNQPGTYKEIKDTSIVAQFKVNENEKSAFLFQAIHEKTQDQNPEVFILAWTTTPWTLPSNAALTVGKNIHYQLIQTFNPYTFLPVYVVCARERVGAYFPSGGKDQPMEFKQGDKILPWSILAECQGSELEGISYAQLMPYVQPKGDAFRVIIGDFVTTEDGTGVVHTAPTFGADDFRVAQKNDIPAILVTDENGNPSPLVDKRGRFVSEVFDFANEPVKEQYLSEAEKAEWMQQQQKDKYLSVDERIGIKLKTENRAFNVQKFEHPYPHCWRTDKPVLYYPMESWFIKTTAYKDKLTELNKTINWKPAATGVGRFGNWLENLVDWNLSRSRFWGTPLPIWRTEDGTEEICVGSLQQLESEVLKAANFFKTNPNALPKDKEVILNPAEIKDLHKPFVDQIVLISPNGKLMFRESDLVDVWFDSGAMPYAQWHFPMENKETFKVSYPADFIAEGVDQTRGWFFTLHALAVLLNESSEEVLAVNQANQNPGIAFKNVIANGLVLDKNGNKMSKRLGNTINPMETISQYGADPTRWYMISNAPPWENLKFNMDGVVETQRKFFGTLINTYNFFALYANLDGFEYAEPEVPVAERTESDRWIISRINTLIETVTNALDDYDPTIAARAIQDFVNDELSNWYVRLNRKRFWKGDYNSDKIAAYQTLYFCLDQVLKLAAPIAPFVTEKLFQSLNSVSSKTASVSVHLADFPKADPSCIDSDLEERMHNAQLISSLVHSLRKAHKLKVRQPLARILIPVSSPGFKEKIQTVEDIILSEVNVKKLEYIENTAGLVTKKAKPNFKKLGKSLGEKMPHFTKAINNLTQEEILTFENSGSLSLDLNGEMYTVQFDDLEIFSEDIPGWIVATESGITVALDLALTDELRQEGFARDVVNRVQNMRKESGMDVQAKIKIMVENGSDAFIEQALNNNSEYIRSETQALELILAPVVDEALVVDLDDFQLKMSIQEVSNNP